MRRDELITKLARELPHWPAGLNKEQLDRLIAPVLMPEFADDYHGCVDNCGVTEAYLHIWDITRADYLAECDRLDVTSPEPMPGPVKSTWDGEGLPPVGTVCEAKLDSDAWVEAEILAHYRPNGPTAGGPEVAVFAYRRTPTSDNRHVDQLIPEFFRPIRSDEDKQIDAMKSAASISYVKPEYMEMICRALYRAGYRKTGGDV